MNSKLKRLSVIALSMCMAFTTFALSACGNNKDKDDDNTDVPIEPTPVESYETVEYKAKKAASAEEMQILNDLSQYIEQARTSLDVDYRAGIYSSALDEVMKLAIELPVYQRKDLYAYNKKNIVGGLLPADEVTTYQSPLAKIWEVEVAPGHGALVIANETMNGVFNPFFYTTVPDQNIIEKVTMSLLSSDKYGNLVADESSLAYDYWYTMNDKNGNVVTNSAQADTTTYTFKIRDGVKFSDGSTVTMDDILFYYYLLLDPAYTGSITLYTVDIQGLASYRAQMDEDIYNKYYAVADAIYNAGDDGYQSNSTYSETDYTKFWEFFAANGEEFAQDITDYCLVNYLEFVQDYFSEDYTADDILSDVKLQTAFGMSMWGFGGFNADGNFEAYDSDGTTWTLQGDDYPTAADYWAVMADCYGGEYDELYDTESVEGFTDFISETYTDIIGYFGERDGNNKTIDNISGIKTSDADNDGFTETLEVTINGVDPAAIYQLVAFVTPRSYYGLDESGVNATLTKNNYVPDQDQLIANGVAFDNSSFMAAVQQITVPVSAGPYMAECNRDTSATTADASGMYSNGIVYLQANPYFTTANISGETGNGTATYTNSVTTPKTEKIRFQELASTDLLYNSLTTGTVDFCIPTATAENVADLEARSGDFGYYLVDYLGYGYIGINAKFVNELEARQAIMYAMDRSLIFNYYRNGLAEIIERCMSKTSWAYPQGATAYYPYDETGLTSFKLLQSVGYKVKDPTTGNWYNPNGPTLKLNFYVAGTDAQSHPTSQTFVKAAEILNNIGCEITVVYDSNVLDYLTDGSIAVWAAAYGATTDPDLYQVYHKDSQATNVIAYGYDYLLGKVPSAASWYSDYAE